MYIAGSSSPASSWRRRTRGLAAGRRGRYERIALAVPLTIAALAAPVQLFRRRLDRRRITDEPAHEARGDRGPRPDDQGRRHPTSSAGTTTAGSSYGIPIPRGLSLLAKHDPNATIQGLDAVPPRDRPPRQRRARAFQTMVGIGRCWRCWAWCIW